MLVDYKCKDCDKTDTVVWDAYATWDPVNQEMILHSSYDTVDCNECGSESIEEIEYVLESTK